MHFMSSKATEMGSRSAEMPTAEFDSEWNENFLLPRMLGDF